MLFQKHLLHSLLEIHVLFVFFFAISLAPPLFIAVPVPNQESERSYICVLGVRGCVFVC